MRAKKRIAVFGVCMLALCCMSGCGAKGNEARDDDNRAAAGGNTRELAGSIRIVGSTSMERLSDALAESFMEKYPGVSVTVEYVGSGAGIQAVIAGTADIGNSSRNLKEEEIADGAVENIVAMDGIVVCVDPANTVKGLTRRQLADIYTGAVTSWSELGGPDVPVVAVGCEAGSGTRNAFEELLGVRDVCAYANELTGTGAVMAKVASTPGAVGYVSLEQVDDSVIALSLDGVEPTAENVREGSYFLCRPFVMVTRGEISEQNELIRAWFDYVVGEEGRRIAEQAGLVTAD